MKLFLQSPVSYGVSVANGVATYVNNIVPALNDVGVEAVIGAVQHSQEYSDGVSSIDIAFRAQGFIDKVLKRINKNKFYERTALRISNEILNKYKPQICEFEDARGDSLLYASALSLPIVVRLHGPWFLTNSESINFNRINREGKAIYSANAISAPSLDVISRVENYYNFDIKLKKCIPNPVSLAPLHLNWRRENLNQRNILYVGRIDIVKGVDIALKAFLQLKKIYKDLSMTIVGSAKDFSLSYKTNLTFEQYVQSIVGEYFAESIEFLGEQPQDVIQRLRSRCSVVVVPSRYETFGYTCLESMAQGVPTVVSNSGGGSEIVRDGVDGLLFNSESSDSLVLQVCKYLDYPDFASDVSVQSLRRVKSKYIPPVVALQLKEFYSEVIDLWHSKKPSNF